ncbi:hypothetical protein H106_04181 [Trichophyton rubrum CBS 735.88]|nr:hypothetical protein H106_04181 [Trichophyton rubrum CBS 735.88]
MLELLQAIELNPRCPSHNIWSLFLLLFHRFLLFLSSPLFSLPGLPSPSRVLLCWPSPSLTGALPCSVQQPTLLDFASFDDRLCLFPCSVTVLAWRDKTVCILVTLGSFSRLFSLLTP